MSLPKAGSIVTKCVLDIAYTDGYNVACEKYDNMEEAKKQYNKLIRSKKVDWILFQVVTVFVMKKYTKKKGKVRK